MLIVQNLGICDVTKNVSHDTYVSMTVIVSALQLLSR